MIQKTYTNIFSVYTPNSESELPNIQFSSVIDNKQFVFNLLFRNNNWICWVIMPDSSIRYFGFQPNVIDWFHYTDYAIVLNTTDSIITLDNIQNQQILVVKWAI